MHMICWKGKKRKGKGREVKERKGRGGEGRGEEGREGKHQDNQHISQQQSTYIVPKEWGEGRTEKLSLWYILDGQ